ncbi:MAG: transglycosylase domain-containing protein [Cellulosilyticaceae bacterium]
MNYSKDSRDKAQDAQQDKKKTKKKKKTRLTALRVLLITLIILIFAGFGAGLGMFIGIIKSAPDVSQIELKPTTDYTSFVYDQNGSEVDRIDGGENRIYAKLDQIPVNLQHAVVAIEDERFYDHNGIDIRGILRAVVKNLKSGDLSEGASTITQQLVKNNVLSSEKKFTRKIQEQYLAIEFEKIYDKAIILEYYLNTMPLGRGTNGVQAAANRYFNKDVSQLTLAESVVLAGITQAPTRFDPITNPENNWDKAQIILGKMETQGYITPSEHQAALLENPYENIQEVQQEYAEQPTHSYFVDAVVEEVLADLQSEKGMTATQANNMIYGGGVQIYTTLDQKIQSIVDTYMAKDALFPQSNADFKINYSVSVKKADGSVVHKGWEGIVKNEADIEKFKQAKLDSIGVTTSELVKQEVFLIPQPQAAFVISDYRTGQVKALSGGRGDKQGDRTFNRATQAKRQPGSTFKILSAYAPALDMGLLAPGSTLIDEEITIGKWTPRNWYNYFKGPVSVREAIWDSMNIPAVKATQMVGLDAAFDYLQNFGFTNVLPSDKVPSLPLGGISGITLMELNAAYAAIANNGTYIEPTLYTKVLDRDGNVLLDKQPETHTVIKESTSSMMTNMMLDVVSKGTGTRIRNNFTSQPVAGKTGTTNDNKDLTFAGYTPYYVASIWAGHDNNKDMGKTGGFHLDVWSSIMNDVHKGLEYKSFPLNTSGYVEASVCSLSGKKPTSLCKLDSDHRIVSDYFLKSQLPEGSCDRHVEKRVCTVSGKIATEYCPAEVVKSKVIGLTSGTADAVTPADLCDVHTAESVKPEEPEPSLPDGTWPDGSWPDGTWPPSTEQPGEGGSTVPEAPDTGTGDGTPEVTPPTTPTPEPEEPPKPPTNPDGGEDNGFFVPQG